MPNYWDKYPAIHAWLRSVGYVEEDEQLAIAWGGRIGYDYHSVIFNPHDKGVDVICGQHASGRNPRILIGTCESLDDVQRTHEAIRLINGYPEAEPNRGPESSPVPSLGDF